MSTSIDEYAEHHAAHAKAARLAAKLYPDARLVRGRVFEVDGLQDADDIVIDDDGAWPCVWVGPKNDRSSQVVVRERRYYAPLPLSLVLMLGEDPRGTALLLALIRGEKVGVALDSVNAETAETEGER